MNIKYTRHAAGTLPSSGVSTALHQSSQGAAGPLVSCLMVTRGNPLMVSSALACFRAQTWQNRELIVVCENITAELRDLLKDEARATLIAVTQKMTLGDLRNLSVAHSRGTYVCQWDDDDLYDPQRIAVQMDVLNGAGVMSVFLSRWLIWWPAREILALSANRVWEGSMLAHRSVLPIYPSLPRREDSVVTRWITSHHATTLIDWPQMYCYRVTGQNTWDETHFEDMLSRATKIFGADEQQTLLRLPCFNQS